MKLNDQNTVCNVREDDVIVLGSVSVETKGGTGKVIEGHGLPALPLISEE